MQYYNFYSYLFISVFFFSCCYVFLIVSLNMATIYCDKCHTDIKFDSNNTVHLGSNNADNDACSFFFSTPNWDTKNVIRSFSGLSFGSLVNLAVVSGATDCVNLQNWIKNFHWTLKLIFLLNRKSRRSVFFSIRSFTSHQNGSVQLTLSHHFHDDQKKMKTAWERTFHTNAKVY